MRSNVGITPQQEILPVRTTWQKVLAVIAVSFMVIGTLLTLTIMLAFTGIPLVFIGLMVYAFSWPKKPVSCEVCGTEEETLGRSPYIKCKGCGTKTMLHWK